MAEKAVAKHAESDVEPGLSRVYEIGYHVAPVVKEEDVEKVVAEIRAAIEKVGGSFITEGAPSLTRLAYEITGLEGGKRVEYDRAYFGWLKFEAPAAAAKELDESVKGNKSILRHIIFKTVREDTRAHIKAPTLRTVARTDTIKTAPKREENAAPVSEIDLDKAIEDITAE
ncbi:MAG TPA: 30S ribosomal protein S6 [Candidatus Paceibacterota bacterium]|nr:30S ribosomal protein S6 [Candidatus Paceibacterota bacterium]